LRHNRLTSEDWPILLSAGFRSQGLYADLLWRASFTGELWQAELGDNEYIMFQEHDQSMRRVDSQRTMTREEFKQRFGV